MFGMVPRKTDKEVEMTGERKRRGPPGLDEFVERMLLDELEFESPETGAADAKTEVARAEREGLDFGLSAFDVAKMMALHRLKLSRMRPVLSRLFPRQPDLMTGLRPMGVLGLTEGTETGALDVEFVNWMVELRRVLRELGHDELVD